LPILWLVGFSVLMLRLMAARVMLWSGERRGKVVAASQKSTLNEQGREPSDDAILDAFKVACQQLSVRRPVRLLIHSEQTIPVVWGIIRLRLLLPENARTWSAEQLQSVLLHELAHIKRRDAMTQLLAQVACALHWFNPLVWFASWRLHVERERACDDLVLANGVPPSAYAEHLLDVATRLSTARWAQAMVRAVDQLPVETADDPVPQDDTPNDDIPSTDDPAPSGEDSPKRDDVKTADTSVSAGPVAKKSTAKQTPKKYGTKDWAGWFVKHARHRKQNDGTFPGAAFKYLRKYVTDDLTAKPGASGADEARAWLEATAVEKNWMADDFVSMVERIGNWRLTVIQRAMHHEEFASRCSPRQGQPATPEKLRGISFGPAAKNGLRVAWVFDPMKKEYAVGRSLPSRVVVHNSGSQAVQFLGGVDSQDGDWSIRVLAGEPVPTKHLPYSNVWQHRRMLPYQRYRLKPGQIVELPGQGIGLGKGDHSASKTQVVIWRIIEAVAGDTVRISVETGLGLTGVRSTEVGGGTVRLTIGADQFYTKDEFPEERARDWSGTLRSGEVKFKVVADAAAPPAATVTATVAKDETPVAGAAVAAAPPADELKPKHADGQTVFRTWQASARADGKIPGALIGQLGEWVKYFIELNDRAGESGAPTAKFKELLPRFDATHDWTAVDAVALIDDVSAVHRLPLINANRAAAGRVMLTGEPLPAELKAAPWGKPAPNGLRVAWHVQPHAKEYRLGTSLRSRILVHNSGGEAVFFIMPSWQQSSTHAARDAQDEAIEVSSTYWTTMATMRIYRLAPDAYCESLAPGIGVGGKTCDEDWAHVRPGAWIEAKVGDEVRLAPGAVEVRMSPTQVGTRHMNGFQDPKDAADLWNKFVAERVARVMPIPAGAADREQLLRRLVRDLFDEEPSKSEIAAFVADKSPAATNSIASRDLLVTRVLDGRNISPFTGTLPPGEITFKVLAADPDAAKRPRVATGPGFYNIADKRRLAISQSRNGKRRVNNAEIIFYSFYSYNKDKPTPKPYTVTLPEGRLTYAVVWDRDATELWVSQKGLLRRIDFSNPSEVKEVRFKSADNSNIPERFRKAIKAVLDVPGAPVQQQSSAKPKGGAKLNAGMETNLKWGATVKGLRAAISFRRHADEVNDLYVVVQNVSDAPIRLDETAAANRHRVLIRLKGVVQQSLREKDPGVVDVILQPREVVFVPVFGGEARDADGHTLGWVLAKDALNDPNWTMTVDLTVEQAPAGAWRGKLLTADTNGSETAAKRALKPSRVPAEKPDAPQPQSGTKLEPGREDNLQWGEPVNGLRAALISPPALGMPEAGQRKDFEMVIQNVSQAPIRLIASSTVPNPRSLIFMSRKFGWAQSRTRILEPSQADFLLQPREIAVIDIVPPGGPQGTSVSRNRDVLVSGDMTIAKAPPGAWTGTLVTAVMHAPFVAHGLLPKDKHARELFILWNHGVRWNRKVPGGLIGILADSVKVFTTSNPTWKTTPPLLKILPRLDATRDWEGHEALALLDELAAVETSPIQAVLENEKVTTVRRGKPLPKELANAPWGEAHPNGLRVAWLLGSNTAEHRLGTPLKSRILFHNSGKNAVVFRTRNWRQSGLHKAHNAKGADINISSTSWLTRAHLVPHLLHPGEFIEVTAAGIGVGPRGDNEAWKGARVGSWIEAKVGDEVTFNPVLVSAKSISNADGEPDWWVDFVTARLHRELPLPMGDEIRRRLLYHVALDLGTTHGGEITSAFLADRNPNALDTLAKRLAEHSSPIPFAGSLQSGPTKFRVLPADPDAVKKLSSAKLSDVPAKDATNSPATAQPSSAAKTEAAAKPVASRNGKIRSANHSGEYRMSDGRDRKLFVCRPTVFPPWLTVIWPESEAWPESRLQIYPKLSVENYRNWAVVWEAEGDDLWFVDDTAATHVDLTNPAEVLTTRQEFAEPRVLIFKFPERVRQEFQRLGFEIPRSKQSTDNHVTDGQAMLSGESLKTWTVKGTVTGKDGNPMADVPIRLRTAFHPTIDVVATKTDAEGNYRVNFRLDLRTIARYRGFFVEPALDGFTERDAEESGLFEALLYQGDKAHSVKVRRYPPMWITGSIAGENEVGPIRRFSKRDLVLGQTARADFVMLPASVITGEIVDPDGKPLALRYISVSAPDTTRPRGYETVASTQSDKKGRFGDRRVKRTHFGVEIGPTL
jgi:hypothetical protein